MDITSFEKQGKKQVFKPVFGSVAELLEHHAKQFGNKTAIVAIDVDSSKEYHISYAQLEKLATQAAQFLVSRGIKKGDRIAFALQNTGAILVLELATGLIGASSVPLDTKRDTKERKIFKLQDAHVRLVFARTDEPGLKEEIEEVRNAIPAIEFVLFETDEELFDLFAKSKEPLPKKNSIEQEYLLLYTSGTTLNPKGVPLRLRAFLANAKGIAEWLELSEQDVFGIVLPLHHINSTTMSFVTLLQGGTIVLYSRYSASRFWQIASNHKVTVTSIVPTILHDLLVRKEEYFSKEYPLFFKRILIGSAPVLPEETLAFIKTFGIDVIQGYGQTETALRVTGVPISLPRNTYKKIVKNNSIGKELAYCNVTVLREDGTEAAEKEEGEICIRGPILGDGYWNNAEETEKAFVDGWFHTGDLGFYEILEGEKYFFMKGRIKEIIIKGGVNISPAAIEDVLLKNFSQINEVCVVGYQDSRMGEEVAAVITLLHPEERSPDGKGLAENIVHFGGAGKLMGLSRYEAPAKVFVIDEELPKTSTGKIQRVKVKEMVADWVAKDKSQHLYCRLIEEHEKEILKKAVEIHNKRWPVASSEKEFEQRAKNAYVIGVFNDEENLVGTVSALQITENDLKSATTWDMATSKGTLENHNPQGEIMLCVSITVDTQEEFPEVKTKIPQKLADAVVGGYMNTDLDNVIRFHRKPKGGMQKGAEVIKILPKGRSEDTEAIGYNVLLEYPEVSKRKKIIKSKAAPASVLLIEQAMQLAKEKACKKVVAFSRPAQFRLYLAKALDPSINFEPKDKKEFAKFATLVKKVSK